MRIAIIGLGAIGSQALLHLSSEPGIQATGYERYGAGHAFGASGGENRLFSTVGTTYPNYSDLIGYSLKVWHDLSARTGAHIVETAGYLAVHERGRSSGAKAALAARSSHESVRVLDAAQLRQEFGFQRYLDDDLGVYDPAGGMIRTDAAVSAALVEARRNGASVRLGQPVSAIAEDSSGVRISTEGAEDRFDLVIVTTGPWLAELLPGIRDRVSVRRPTSAWFLPRDADVLATMPAVSREGEQQYYAAPTFDRMSLKVGYSGLRQSAIASAPSNVDRVCDPNELGEFPRILEEYLTSFEPQPYRLEHYFEGYTDSAFPVVQHVNDRVVAGVGFSGLGFKFSPVFGRLLAEIAIGKTPSPLLAPMLEVIPRIAADRP